MKKNIHIAVVGFFLFFAGQFKTYAQPAAPYCNGNYTSGQCNQPGPSNSTSNFVNDFIDDFSTSGASTNISNLNSGCNGNTDNYINYCNHYMVVTPGQTITCTLQSGITYQQGFAIWVDWNQDNTYNTSTEYMGGTATVPPAATPTTIVFTIPANQPNGIYHMRVRCAFATPGPSITPCGTFGYGETEDYVIYVGSIPSNAGVPSGTAIVNSPICVGQALNFTLVTTYSAALSYTWTGPNSYSSTLQNPIISNAGSNASGVYTVLVSNSVCPITATVAAVVVDYPSFTPVANHYTICQGGLIVAQASLNPNSANNPALYTYSWTSISTSAGLIFNPQLQITTIQPALLPSNVPQASVLYSITVSPTLNPTCKITQTLGITIYNPLTPTLNLPASICNTIQPIQLTATPSGGTWGGNPAVSASGSFSPALAAQATTNSVTYSVSASNCIVSNSGTILVSRFISPALTSTVATRCVQDAPFNLMNIVQNTVTGRWTGSNSSVVNNFFIAAGLPSGSYNLQYNTLSTPDSNACPGSTPLVIQVFNPPTPTIFPIAQLCDNASTVALTATPPNGVWSGNSGVSSTGIQTPSLNLVGTNTVSYSAGQGTCVASTSASFQVSHYNTPALTGSIQNLCVTSNPVNLMSIVQNTSGVWSGVNVVNGVFSPANPLNLLTNIYTFTYNTSSSPNATLCADYRLINISVLNPVQPVIAAVGPFCSKTNPLYLSVAPATGYWVTTPYLTSGGVFIPSLATIGNNIVNYVIGTSTCHVQQSSTIKVENFVSAALTSKIDDQCNSNLPLPLTPITANGSGNWTGVGVVGSNFDPAIAGSGNFILSYHTASYPSGLCPDLSTVAVNVFSLAPPTITQIGPFCNSSAPMQLQVSPLGGSFGSGISGAVSTAGLFNPGLAAVGDNYINYTVTVGPCHGNAQTKISVEAFVSADFSKMIDPYICRNHEPFNLNSYVQNPGGAWSGEGVVGNMFYPSLANIGDNNFITYETHSSPSTQLCRDTSLARIRVKNIPTVKAVSSSYGGCAPLEVDLNDQSANSGKGVWNITDGTQYEGLSANHIFKNPGTYTVVFTYSDDEAQGCTAQYVIPTAIVVNETPKADFTYSPNEVTLADPEVNITNLSTVFANNRYVWTVQGEKNQLTELNPVVKFTVPGNYKITLLATSVAGCTNEISKIVEVKNDFNVHIPNSFTPNFDGKNDVFIPVFTPYGLDAKTFEMEIFDRWGHQVYHSWDVTKGWDGTIQGEVVKEDTYVYRVRFRDLDGRSYTKTGHVALLKN